jgi:predicted permease
MLGDLIYRLRALFRRSAVEAEMNDELRFHFEQEVEKYVKAGLSREEAQRRARLAFGTLDEAKEECREARGIAFIETTIQDLRYGLRQLRRNPGFTAVVIATLCLGIGANIAIFGVVSEVLLQPPPYKNPDRLVTVWATYPRRGIEKSPATPADFLDWKAQNRVFEEMASSTDEIFTLTGIGEPEQIIGYSFSPQFFHVLGVKAMLGRTFLPSEDTRRNDHVVVLSYPFWQRVFGGDKKVLGRAITLSGVPYTIIGVMPPGFTWPGGGTELWTPLALDPSLWSNRHASLLRVMARLRRGITLKQAQKQMTAIAKGLDRRYPDTNAGEGVKLVSLRKETVGDIQPALVVLLIAVGFVLLIACVNVANLLLARGMTREKETAIRMALGAGRRRLIRQFLTESVLLSLIGGTLGLLLALWGARFLLAIFPNNIANLSIPHVTQIPFGSRVLSFALGLSAVTGLVFGLAPALRCSNPGLNENLKEAGRASTAGTQTQRIRGLLVVSEVALALMLLVGAGLTVKSFEQIAAGDLGLDPSHVLTMEAFLPPYKYSSSVSQWNFVRKVVEHVRALPGVDSAAGINFLPLSGFWGIVNFTVDGRAAPKLGQGPQADNRVITPGYFKTMRIPLLRGREFTAPDGAGAPHVVIINRKLADRYWPNADPLGRRLNLGPPQRPDWWQIVGVVGDVKAFGLQKPTHLDIYRPFAQFPMPLVAFTVRTGPAPLSLADSVKKAIWQVDRSQPVFKVVTMKELAAESVALRRVSMWLLGGFSFLALIVAAIGVYGVMSFSVSQRMHEIGIRVALGAQRRDVLRILVGQGMGLVILGVGIGVAAALGLTHLMTSLLYGVKPTDPLTFVAVSVILLGVALLACYIPARRATKVDPVVALRYE